MGGVVNLYGLVREGLSDKGIYKRSDKKWIWQLRGQVTARTVYVQN